MLLELTVVEQRFNAVMEVLRDGLKVIEVAERYGVSRQAVHGWLRRYAAGGLDALADRSHRVGYGNPGVACELAVRSSLGFGALILFVSVEAP